MFLWIVLMIMIGFLIGKSFRFSPEKTFASVGHHFYRSGSIINTVTSPDYQAGETDPANAQLKMDTQIIDVRN